MIIYIEKEVKDYPRTKKILEKFKNSKHIFIDNYKNIFDKSYKNIVSQKALIIAKLNSPSITKAPEGYGHSTNSYFLKTSLNCVFNCSYCYLKGLFKNENMVIFVNYDDIKDSIKKKVGSFKKKNKEILTFNDSKSSLEGQQSCSKDFKLKTSNCPLDTDHGIWFYSGDYSDIVGMNDFSGFIEEFVPFFEEFGENIMLEIRTKSANIKAFLDLGFIPKNTEIAFSLNPQSLIEKYEKGSSSLEKRIEAINTLVNMGFKVGLRFLPLLPVKDYKKIYGDFIDYIQKNIDTKKIYSIFISGLLYTKKDYNKMLLKYRDLDILYMLELDNDGFYRESRKLRDDFYNMFQELSKKCFICLDK